MTRKQMADRVQFWLGLQDIVGYDETTLIHDLLYDGTLDVLSRTKCVARCLDLRVTAGIDTYTLDHGVLALVDVEDGHRLRARRDQDDYWDSGANGVVVYPPGTVPLDSCHRTFTLIRSDILVVRPTPSEDGEIQTWAVMRPQRMAADDDSPGDEAFGAIPEEFQDAITGYALWKGSDYSDDQSGAQGERYRTLYEGQDGRGGRLAQIRIAVNKRGTSRAPRRRVRMRGISSRSSWVG